MFKNFRDVYGQNTLGYEHRNPHQNANDYKELCREANLMSKKEYKGNQTKNEWRVVDNYHDKKSNFKGVLYEKDGQYALTFVGTDKWSYKDHGANLKMATTGDSKQIREAKKFASSMKGKYGLTPDNTVSIGHSEGGTEATVVGVDNEFKTVTFNAYGVSSKQLEKGKNYDTLVTNYRDAHDPVSKLHGNIGTTYITPSTQSTFMSKTPFGSIQSHGIGNMGDCERAVPVDQYKKSNPMFLDKISDTDISRKDIADMDSNLFKVYEKEIDTRVANNQIKQNDNSGHSIEKSTTSSGKSSSSSSSDGKWVTINGNHVLIKD